MCCQMGWIGCAILQVAQKAIVIIQFLLYFWNPLIKRKWKTLSNPPNTFLGISILKKLTACNSFEQFVSTYQIVLIWIRNKHRNIVVFRHAKIVHQSNGIRICTVFFFQFLIDLLNSTINSFRSAGSTLVINQFWNSMHMMIQIFAIDTTCLSVLLWINS